MTTSPQYVAEIVVYDPSLGAERTLTYAVTGFASTPTDTPANTIFDPRVDQPIDIERSMFAARATRGRATTAYGQLILLNGDGALDALNELAFDGRSVTLRRTTTAGAAYPGDYDTFLVATIDGQPEFTLEQIRVTVRDRLADVVAAQLQTTRYAGDNVLPDGLEGVPEDLAGKPKPVCFGVVKSVPTPCVNTSKLIYQVNDGAVASIDAVRDRGVALIPGHAWSNAGAVGTGAGSPLLAFGGGLWVRTSPIAGTVHTSPDGVTWTLAYTLSGGSPALFKAVYHAGEWLVFGNRAAGAILLHTTDDFATVTTSAAPANGIVAGFYHEFAGVWIAISATTIWTSPNASTWTSRYSSGSGLSDGAYRVAIGVVVGAGASQQGVILSSTDAINWVERTTDIAYTSASSLTTVIAGPDRFVACGANTVAVSFDGITWQRALLPATSAGGGSPLAYANGLYLVLRISDGFFVSVDGLVWGTVVDGMAGVSLVAIAADSTNVVTSDALRVIRATTPTTYASLSDLLDDDLAPLPGQYIPYLAGGYVRLGSTPDAPPVCDVTQGATSADRTGAQIADVVLQRAGIDPSDIDGGDLTALDAADDAELGYWTMQDGVTCADVLDAIAATLGASWFVGADGVFHVQQLDAPSGTPDLVIAENDVIEIERVSPADGGIPPYQVTLRWGRNYQTVTSDIAGAVSDADRAQLAQPWRDAVVTDDTIRDVYPSSQPLVVESLYATAADALAGATRESSLRATKRDLYAVTVALDDDTALIDLHDVVEVVHRRFALSVVSSPSGARDGGGLFRVLDVKPDAKAGHVTFTLWGRSRFATRIDAAGDMRATTDGTYRITTRSA